MKKQNEQSDILQNFIVDGTCAEVRNRYAGFAEKALTSDFGDLDEDIVVIDTETTGFSLNHDELIQIAAARMVHGEIKEWFVTFVNPGRPIPEEIVHLTNISDADVAEAPVAAEALDQLVEFVGDSDLLAHNAEFDFNFVTKYPAGKPLEQNSWFDSLDLARITLPRLKSHRLLDLARAFSAPISTHRADADVEALCVVYRILLAAATSMPAPLLREISGMTTKEVWPTIEVFQRLARLSVDDKKENGEENGDRTQEKLASFSLRALRAARVNKLTKSLRVDAESLAQNPETSLSFPTAEEVRAAFEKTGLVGSLYEDFEARAEQVSMAELVLKAYSSSTNLAIEAGTGVGKSMAYLLPSVLTAKKNNITVGIATKTNALLDQLIYKELPLLEKSLQENTQDKKEVQSLDFVSLKGFSHYPCLRQINRIVNDGPLVKTIAGKEVPQAPALAGLLSFIEQSEYDDIDSLKIDYRVLPRYLITTSSQECFRRKCPFYGTLCFVHGARRRAESADIVVTNHSLLFCDIAADGGLLPPIRHWVVDEAHGAEDEARRSFSLVLAADELLRLGRRVASNEASQNAFIRAERRAATDIDDATLFYALIAKARAAGKDFQEAAEEFCKHIKDLAFFDTNKRSKGYETTELWLNDDIRQSETFRSIASYGRTMCEKGEKLITASQEVVAILEGAESAAEAQREIATIAMGLKEIQNAAEIILFSESPAYAYSASFSKRNDRTNERLEARLVSVGERLNETLYINTHSVIFTSATMSVDNTFDSFETALGLNESEFSHAVTYQLDSSYDFDKNMTIYVADDIPEPNDPDYIPALQHLLIAVHKAQHGSMLTLFTNRREMEKCFEVVQPALKPEDLRVVCQKWGLSVKGLRDEFLADEHLSLFALKSFWEGFDAPGATLKGVIVPKLPFAKPSDPLSCERALRDNQAWKHYVLPAAVLETKQAAGRLIRKADDSGCLIFADRRLLTRGYGKAFLNSMPSNTIKVCSSLAIAEELALRYDEKDPMK